MCSFVYILVYTHTHTHSWVFRCVSNRKSFSVFQVSGTTWRKLWWTSSLFTLRYKVKHVSFYFISWSDLPKKTKVCPLQVFTVSRDLVPRVLSRIVESVADEMCRLMQCVSAFSKNGALQVRAAPWDSYRDPDSDLDPLDPPSEGSGDPPVVSVG